MFDGRSALPETALLVAGLAASFALPASFALVIVAAVPFLWAALFGSAGRWRKAAGLALVVSLPMALIGALLGSGGSAMFWRGPVLPLVGKVGLSGASLILAATQSLRLFSSVTLFAVYEAVADRDGLESLISSLSPRLAVLATVSSRMLPVLAADTDRVMLAQRCRGASFGPLASREAVAERGPIMMKVTEGALLRALNLAEALESRGFGAGRRRDPFRRPLRPADWSVLALAVAAAGAAFGGAARPGLQYLAAGALAAAAAVSARKAPA